MNYNFDEIINRENSGSLKYDLRKAIFGNKEVIPLWVADMDFRTPDYILNALEKKIQHGVLGYPAKPLHLDDAIANWIRKRHNWDIHKSWITLCPGVVPVLAFCVLAYTRPGDEIIVQPPVYFPFFYTIEHNGRRVVNNPLVLQNGRYHMNLDDLEKKINARTKMIFLCNPHNPGGMVWKKEELESLAGICLEHNILIISDEIHSDLMLFGNKHIPTATLSQDVARQTVTCMSSSKTFNTAGLTTAYTVIPDGRLRNELSGILGDFHLSFGNAMGMEAMEAAYMNGESWLDQLLSYLEGNVLFVESFIRDNIPDVEVIRPEGTFLMWLDFRNLGMDSEKLNYLIIHQAGLGMSDGRLFGTGGSGFQRLNIACPRSILDQAMQQLNKIIRK